MKWKYRLQGNLFECGDSESSSKYNFYRLSTSIYTHLCQGEDRFLTQRSFIAYSRIKVHDPLDLVWTEKERIASSEWHAILSPCKSSSQCTDSLVKDVSLRYVLGESRNLLCNHSLIFYFFNNFYRLLT